MSSINTNMVPERIRIKNRVKKTENMDEIQYRTYRDIFNGLFRKERMTKDDFKTYMNKKWLSYDLTTVSSKDKLESFYRFFTILGLNPKLQDYKLCEGNLNLGDIYLCENIYNYLNIQNIKDNNGKSDLTLYRYIPEEECGELIVSSSKNFNRKNSHVRDDNYDLKVLQECIESIPDNVLRQFKIKDRSMIKMSLIVSDKNELDEIMRRSNQDDVVIRNNIRMIEIIKENDLLFDIDDIFIMYNRFMTNFVPTSFDDLIINNKMKMGNYFHQDLCIKKTLKLINKNIRKIIWGQICRSGKSYMMNKLIIKRSELNNTDQHQFYLIITMTPGDTKSQHLEILNNYEEFEEYDIISDLQICEYTGEFMFDDTKKKHILFFSMQKILNEKNKSFFLDNMFKRIRFDLFFLDESHLGGTTVLSQEVINSIKSEYKIFMTATYNKPLDKYNISKKNGVYLDLYDYYLMSNINNNSNKSILCERFDITEEEFDEIMVNYTNEELENEYSKIPKLNILTWELNQTTVDHILDFNHIDKNKGFSINSALLLRKNRDGNYTEFFQNEKSALSLLTHVFGTNYSIEKDITSEYTEKMINGKLHKINTSGFLGRIEKIRERDSEYINEDHKDIYLCFLPILPEKNWSINKLQQAITRLIERHNKIDGRFNHLKVMSINSNSGDAKDEIRREYERLEEDKKALIVLTGKKCHLGVTLEYCDVVVLMNNFSSMDTLFQMAFRGMNKRKNKKNGFVIDLNIQRSIDLLVDYSLKCFKSGGIKNSIERLLLSRIIEFNKDQWNIYFNESDKDIMTDLINISGDNIFQNWYNRKKDILEVLNNDFDKLSLISLEDQQRIDGLFTTIKKSKKTLKNKQTDIPNGIEVKQNITTNSKSKTNEEEIYEGRVNFSKDILRHLIPIMCLLTVDKECYSFEDMFNSIKNQYFSKISVDDYEELDNKIIAFIEEEKELLKEYLEDELDYIGYDDIYEKFKERSLGIDDWNELLEITNDLQFTDCMGYNRSITDFIEEVGHKYSLNKYLVDQLKIWWGDNLEEDIMENISKIYENSFKENEEMYILIKSIKEHFRISYMNRRDLYMLIEKFFQPTDIEQKMNAEISTPLDLRRDMLSKIPNEFWKDKDKKIFEPCVGKGGFVMDIIDILEESLKEEMIDDEERYRHIVENMIYVGDINPMNIYINKLLMDPYNKYNLNTYIGDTLKINIQDEWNILNFDLIVTNPPFNDMQNAKGKRGGGDLLWNHYILKIFKEWIKKDGFITLIHPNGWRKPESERSKYKNLFNLMTKENQMIYLEIHDAKDGMKTFNCGTRYDWYLIQKRECTNSTLIKDEESIITEINLKDWKFLPNSNFNLISKILKKDDDESVNVLYSRGDYDTRKKIVSDTMNEEYKYKLVHTTPKKGVRWMYTNTNQYGYFGVPKVIFGESGINNLSVIDNYGEYGMTQEAIAINDKVENLIKIKECLESDSFSKILKSCSWSNFRIDWRLFLFLKNSFYEELLEN